MKRVSLFTARRAERRQIFFFNLRVPGPSVLPRTSFPLCVDWVIFPVSLNLYLIRVVNGSPFPHACGALFNSWASSNVQAAALVLSSAPSVCHESNTTPLHNTQVPSSSETTTLAVVMTTPVQLAARSENPSEVAALHGYVPQKLPCTPTSASLSLTIPLPARPARRPKHRLSPGPYPVLAFCSPGPLDSSYSS